MTCMISKLLLYGGKAEDPVENDFAERGCAADSDLFSLPQCFSV